MLRPHPRPHRGSAGAVLSLKSGLGGLIEETAASAPLASPTYEKFADPVFNCWGGASPYTIGPAPRPPGLNGALNRWMSMDNQQPVVEAGYEYLSGIPNNAEARVAQMRAVIVARAASRLGSVKGVEPFLIQSRRALAEFSRTLTSTYRKIAANATEALEFAKIAGVSPSLVSSEAAEMASFSDSVKNDYEVINQAVRKYGPIAKTVQTGVMLAIELGTSGGSVKGEAAAALNFLAGVALAIPVYGVFIAAALSLVADLFESAVAATEEFCRETVEEISKLAQTAVDEAVVVPWHALDTFDLTACAEDRSLSAEGYDDTYDQHSLRSVFTKNLQFSRSGSLGLTPNDRSMMQRWWGLAQLYMSDPRVLEVFENLGFDASGGVLASDEQVMLVAAPVAVAYGMDVDTLARDLWNRSGGWRSGKSSWAMQSGLGPDECRGKLPINAWWVQWAVLAEDAFALAEAHKVATGAYVMALNKIFIERDEPSPVSPVVAPAVLAVGAGYAATMLLGLSGPVGVIAGLATFVGSRWLMSAGRD